LANMTSNPFGLDYMAGVEVSSAAGLSAGFSHVNVPAQRYVVFSHHGPVSRIRDTIDAVHKWSHTSGVSAAQPGRDLPVMLERYGERFDPQTGSGDIEIWTAHRGIRLRLSFCSCKTH
jgi:AraC family transcriptional regulator